MYDTTEDNDYLDSVDPEDSDLDIDPELVSDEVESEPFKAARLREQAQRRAIDPRIAQTDLDALASTDALLRQGTVIARSLIEYYGDVDGTLGTYGHDLKAIFEGMATELRLHPEIALEAIIGALPTNEAKAEMLYNIVEMVARLHNTMADGSSASFSCAVHQLVTADESLWQEHIHAEHR